MKKRTKVWLIAAASLILVGCILFVGVMSVLKWDFKKLSTCQYETTTHVVTDSFRHVSITVNTADIKFVPTEDDSVSVVCHEDVNFQHTVAVEDNTLVIKEIKSHKWYHYVGIGFESSTITVYLPAGEYGDLMIRATTGDVSLPIDYCFDSMDVKVTTGDVSSFAGVVGSAQIRATTGDINLKAFTAGSLDVSVSTGDISVKNVNTDDLRLKVTTGETAVSGIGCRSFTSIGTTGDLFMRDLLVDEALVIERDTGDVNFDACDAATLKVTTTTGDILGTLLTQKVFVAHSDTGDVRLPHKAPEGGPCELTTDTGNIHITLEESAYE